MVEGLEPKLLKGVVVFVRTRLCLLLRLRRLSVLLRLQRNRVGSYCGLEFEIAIGACTVAVVRVAGMTESGMGTKSGMYTGLEMGFDMGMLELLWQ